MPNATVSYVAQGAWLMNATLRENITFVSEYQQHKYDAVVEAAGLLQDLKSCQIQTRPRLERCASQ